MVWLVFMAIVYWWSVKSGQMDDLEGPAYRILLDDDAIKSTSKNKNKNESKNKNKKA